MSLKRLNISTMEITLPACMRHVKMTQLTYLSNLFMPKEGIGAFGLLQFSWAVEL